MQQYADIYLLQSHSTCFGSFLRNHLQAELFKKVLFHFINCNF